MQEGKTGSWKAWKEDPELTSIIITIWKYNILGKEKNNEKENIGNMNCIGNIDEPYSMWKKCNSYH